MKVNLEFELPQETAEYELAMNGSALSSAVSEFDNKLRAMSKYEGHVTINIQEARQLLSDCLIEAGIT